MNEKYREFTFEIGNTEFNFYFDGGIVSRDKSYKSGLHSHNYCELIYVYKGKVGISSENESFVFNAGEAAVIPENMLHTMKSLEDPYRIAIAFSIRKLSKKCENTYSQFEKIVSGSSVGKIDNEFCKSAFERLIKYYSGNFDYADELIKSCLCETVIIIKNVLLANSCSVMPSLSQTDGYRNFVIDSLLGMYYVSASQVSLETLSESLHLGKRQIEKIFKKTYGQTFREKAAELKMIHAKELICNTELSVSKVAAEVGYGSTNGFIKAFEKKYGESPNEYRKRKR